MYLFNLCEEMESSHKVLLFYIKDFFFLGKAIVWLICTLN